MWCHVSQMKKRTCVASQCRRRAWRRRPRAGRPDAAGWRSRRRSPCRERGTAAAMPLFATRHQSLAQSRAIPHQNTVTAIATHAPLRSVAQTWVPVLLERCGGHKRTLMQAGDLPPACGAERPERCTTSAERKYQDQRQGPKHATPLRPGVRRPESGPWR